MNLSTRSRPLTALLMAVTMVITSLPLGVASAGMVSTKTMIEQERPAASAKPADRGPRETIRDLLAREDVRAEMIALGIAPAEAEARLAALTDEEIAGIAGRLDQLPAGEGLGTVLIALFIVFGIAVIIDAMGMMDIFPFVCSGNDCAGSAQAYYPEPAADAYVYEERRPAYRDRFDDRRSRRYQPEPYYEPQQPPARNYYEERFGAQRYVR